MPHYQRFISTAIHKMANSPFISFCSTASLELYLVHYTLVFNIHVINKEHQFISLFVFLVLTFILSYVYNNINKSIAQCIMKNR